MQAVSREAVQRMAVARAREHARARERSSQHEADACNPWLGSEFISTGPVPAG